MYFWVVLPPLHGMRMPWPRRRCSGGVHLKKIARGTPYVTIDVPRNNYIFSDSYPLLVNVWQCRPRGRQTRGRCVQKFHHPPSYGLISAPWTETLTPHPHLPFLQRWLVLLTLDEWRPHPRRFQRGGGASNPPTPGSPLPRGPPSGDVHAPCTNTIQSTTLLQFGMVFHMYPCWTTP